MDFLKKYSALLLPIGLTLVALLMLIPTKMISGSVKEALDESSSMYKRIDSLKRNAVPENQWEIEAQYQSAHEQDANTIDQLLKETTMRELLSYNIFPEPTVTSNLIYEEFGRKYIDAIEKLANVVMAAGDAPTDQFLNNLVGNGGRGNYTTMGDQDNARQRIINTACLEKANQIPVYANPKTSFINYDFWKDYTFVSKTQGIEDCWYSQVAYWIMEDVAKSVSEINAGSERVADSKVKRLLGVRFETTEVGGGTSGGGRYGGSELTSVEEKPFYVLQSDEAGLAPTWTNRKSDDDIDVIHFSFAVIISTDAIPEFYTVICGDKEHSFFGWDGKEPEQNFVHNQITILEEKITSIDSQDATHKNYRYGTDAVVKLNLICEYIFQKNGYEEIKPEFVKSILTPVEEGRR